MIHVYGLYGILYWESLGETFFSFTEFKRSMDIDMMKGDTLIFTALFDGTGELQSVLTIKASQLKNSLDDIERIMKSRPKGGKLAAIQGVLDQLKGDKIIYERSDGQSE